MLGLAAIVACGVLWATPAVGQEVFPISRGNQLIMECSSTLAFLARNDSSTSLFGAGQCFGRVWGVLLVSNQADTPAYRRVCASPQVTTLQTVRIVYNWLEDHPERLHEESFILILEALQEAFPCSE